jgi:hypothetical protein
MGAWPADDAGLPGSVQAAVDSWTALTMGPINAAICNLNDDPALTWQTPTGRGHLKVHKARTLVAHGVPAAAGGPTTPLPADLRSMTAAPDAILEEIQLMEQQLATQRDEIAASAGRDRHRKRRDGGLRGQRHTKEQSRSAS